MYVCVRVFTLVHIPHTCGDQGTTLGSQFSPSILWVPGIKLRLLYTLTLFAGFLFAFVAVLGMETRPGQTRKYSICTTLAWLPNLLFCFYMWILICLFHKESQLSTVWLRAQSGSPGCPEVKVFVPLPPFARITGLYHCAQYLLYLEYWVRHWAPVGV